MSQLHEFPACEAIIADLDWQCGPCGHTRDSDIQEECNFIVALRELALVDPDEQDHEVISWGHWACGWVEEIFTRPGSGAEKVALELRNRLDNYPILDEHLLGEYEMQEAADEASSEATCG